MNSVPISAQSLHVCMMACEERVSVCRSFGRENSGLEGNDEAISPSRIAILQTKALAHMVTSFDQHAIQADYGVGSSHLPRLMLLGCALRK
jgi:hypothetical protein